MHDTFSNRSVLLVEDNPYETKLILGIFQAFGFRNVLSHNTVDAAVDEIRRTQVDCIVVDWMLPLRPGIELVHYVRKSKKNFMSDLPIVLCTGYTEHKRIVAARDAGVDEIVAKPFSAEGFYRKLYAAIFKKRPFIAVEDYIGPDRRRQDREFQGFDRRGARGMSQDQIDNLMTEAGAD